MLYVRYKIKSKAKTRLGKSSWIAGDLGLIPELQQWVVL